MKERLLQESSELTLHRAMDIALAMESTRQVPNEVAEQNRFYNRVQQDGESISRFMQELRSLSRYCNFACSGCKTSNIDLHLRTQFVRGLRSEEIRKKLFQESELTLQKAIDIALAMEAPKQVPNEVAEQNRFYNRVQQDGESITTFMQELRSLTQNCNFACSGCKTSNIDLHLRTQFIRGLRSAEIRERLLQESELTLQEAKDIALAMEAPKQEHIDKSKTPIETNGGGNSVGEGLQSLPNLEGSSLLPNPEGSTLLSNPGASSLLPSQGSSSLLSNRESSSLLPNSGGSTLLSNPGASSLLPSQGSSSLLSNREGSSLLPNSGGSSLLSNREGLSLLPHPEGSSLLPNPGGLKLFTNPGVSSLFSNPGGSSLLPNPGGSSLLPNPIGSSLLPNPGGSSLLPNPGGSSLLPNPGGSSLLPNPGGSSLLPNPGGSSLLPNPGGSSLFPNIRNLKLLPNLVPSAPLDFPGFILFEKFPQENFSPVSLLIDSAKVNSDWRRLDFRPSSLNNEERTCEILLNNKVVSSVTVNIKDQQNTTKGKSKKEVKALAAAQAVRGLRKTCYTIKEKVPFFSSTPPIGKDQLRKIEIEEYMEVDPDEIPAEYKNQHQTAQANFQCLQKKLHIPFKKILSDYVDSDTFEDLVFRNEFDNDERRVLHLLAESFCLKTKSHGKRGKRYLVISKTISLPFLLDMLLANGGEDSKYLVIPPTG